MAASFPCETLGIASCIRVCERRISYQIPGFPLLCLIQAFHYASIGMSMPLAALFILEQDHRCMPKRKQPQFTADQRPNPQLFIRSVWFQFAWAQNLNRFSVVLCSCKTLCHPPIADSWPWKTDSITTFGRNLGPPRAYTASAHDSY